MSIGSLMEQALQQHMAERTRDPEIRQRIVLAVMTAFAGLRKKPVPDLALRVQKMQEQVQRLAEEVSVEFQHGNLVVKPAGSAESLIRQFRLGSDWFDPEPDIDHIIVAAALAGPKRS